MPAMSIGGTRNSGRPSSTLYTTLRRAYSCEGSQYIDMCSVGWSSYAVHERMRYLQSYHEAQAEGKIVQRCSTDRHVVHLFKNEWERREHQIHEAIQVGHVAS